MKEFLFTLAMGFAFATAAQASLEQKEKVLLKAKDIQVLRQDLKNIEADEILEKTCALEIARQKVPAHCYEHLQQQQKRKMVSRTGFLKHQKILDHLCEENAFRSEEVLPLKGLTRDCQKMVEKRNEEIRYAKE